MSEKTEKLASLMQRLCESEEGQYLIKWIEETSANERKNASKLEPVQSWGELKSADGRESVVQHINQLRRMTKER